MKGFIALVIGLTLLVGAKAQEVTLSERASEQDGPINRVVFPPIWTQAGESLDELLRHADLIVRGVVGAGPVSYLSNGGLDVLTDYTIHDPKIIFPASAASTTRPGVSPGPITIVQLGGTVSLSGHEVTVSHKALSPLKPGTDGLFLLVADGTKYRLAGDYLDAFSIEQDRIVPLTSNATFVVAHRGKGVAPFIQEVLGRLRSMGRS
jgi:hypothetical protein